MRPFTDDTSRAIRRSVAQGIVDRLRAGERVVVSHITLDDICDLCGDAINDIATARNRNQVGTLDEYVAWIGEKPADLEYRSNGLAYASV